MFGHERQSQVQQEGLNLQVAKAEVSSATGAQHRHFLNIVMTSPTYHPRSKKTFKPLQVPFTHCHTPLAQIIMPRGASTSRNDCFYGRRCGSAPPRMQAQRQDDPVAMTMKGWTMLWTLLSLHPLSTQAVKLLSSFSRIGLAQG